MINLLLIIFILFIILNKNLKRFYYFKIFIFKNNKKVNLNYKKGQYTAV